MESPAQKLGSEEEKTNALVTELEDYFNRVLRHYDERTYSPHTRLELKHGLIQLQRLLTDVICEL